MTKVATKEDKVYLIPESKLEQLLKDSFVAAALECGGVDNWEFYSEAIHDGIETFNKQFETNFEDIDSIAEASLTNFNSIYFNPELFN